MTSFQCEVCFDACTQRLALPPLSTLNGDPLRTRDCMHPVCQACMASLVKARVESLQVFGICCPIEGCKNELYEQDVRKLVENGVLEAEVFERLASLRKQDYSDRLTQLCFDLGSIPELHSFRLCPRCCVVIQKRSGCNSFGCVCGHRFQFDTAPSLQLFENMLSRNLGALKSKHNMSQSEACRHVVMAHCVKGIKNYTRVVHRAESQQMTLELAETHEQAMLGHPDAVKQLADARRLRKEAKLHDMLVANLGVSNHEAIAIAQNAIGGDETSQQKIRQAKLLRSQKRGLEIALEAEIQKHETTGEDEEAFESHWIFGYISRD